MGLYVGLYGFCTSLHVQVFQNLLLPSGNDIRFVKGFAWGIKYRHLVANIDSTTLDLLIDILVARPAESMFKVLQERFTSLFPEFVERILTRPLSEKTLGGQMPISSLRSKLRTWRALRQSSLFNISTASARNRQSSFAIKRIIRCQQISSSN